MSTYLRRAHGNSRYALALYAWNIRAGAALYPILQVNEVTLRNTINRALAAQFGANWPYAQGFLRMLPQNNRAEFLAGRGKLEQRLRVHQLRTGDVVATQTYAFWVLLLTRRFHNRIWRHEFTASFPHAPRQVHRELIREQADSIRKLRNRIAHYEPLLNVHLSGAYRRALAVVRWISPEKAAWARDQWPPAPELTRRG